MRGMTSRSFLILGACAALASCGASPPTRDPLAALALAEEAVRAGKGDQVAGWLQRIDPESYVGEDRERYRLAVGTALYQSGSLWQAHRQLRDFPQDHPFSQLLGQVEELEYRIGRELMRSEGGFLFFTSDAEDGRVVLEDFIVRFPRSRSLPDALHLLGDQAFQERRFQLARERYSQLVAERPDSEWATLARFRIAMSRYLDLQGAEYDQVQTQMAHNELRDFLAAGPENPTMREEAQAAMTVTRHWLAEKRLLIADYYHRIGVPEAERRQLELAAAEYADTPAGQKAAGRLKAAAPDAPEHR